MERDALIGQRVVHPDTLLGDEVTVLPDLEVCIEIGRSPTDGVEDRNEIFGNIADIMFRAIGIDDAALAIGQGWRITESRQVLEVVIDWRGQEALRH